MTAHSGEHCCLPGGIAGKIDEYESIGHPFNVDVRGVHRTAMTGAILWPVGASLAAAMLTAATALYINRRQRVQAARDRSMDFDRTDVDQQVRDWNERHGPELSKTGMLITNTAEAAGSCKRKHRSRRALRRHHQVDKLIARWEILMEKTEEWEFEPDELRKMQEQLRQLYSHGRLPLVRISGACSDNEELQKDAADKILKLQTGALREAELQFRRTTFTDTRPEPPDHASRRGRKRRWRRHREPVGA